VEQDTDLAMAAGPEADGRVRTQPVFCLLGSHLLGSLRRFLHEGGRKIDAWTARHRCAVVPFDRAGDDPLAFANVNTLAELLALQHRLPPALTPAPARPTSHDSANEDPRPDRC
ncbi:MAG: molybdenum cofactor guanylyltransferase MobA, partial [Tepidimonas sp.]